MSKRIQGLRIAVLAADGFEESEFIGPISAFRQEGADVSVVSINHNRIKAWREHEWSGQAPVDITVNAADPDAFDALHLPGGVMNPDRLRTSPQAVDFVKSFIKSGKLVAAICHGPWMLIEADAVRGKRVTSWPSLKTDLKNAGATWVDEPVVQDGNIITSRKPDDIPDYSARVIAALEVNLATSQT